MQCSRLGNRTLMARVAAQDSRYGDRFLIDVVCTTRTELLDCLAEAVESLGRTKLALGSISEEKNSVQGESMRNQIFKLRAECNRIKAELESHRTSHGC